MNLAQLKDLTNAWEDDNFVFSCGFKGHFFFDSEVAGSVGFNPFYDKIPAAEIKTCVALAAEDFWLDSFCFLTNPESVNPNSYQDMETLIRKMDAEYKLSKKQNLKTRVKALEDIENPSTKSADYQKRLMNVLEQASCIKLEISASQGYLLVRDGAKVFTIQGFHETPANLKSLARLEKLLFSALT